MTTEAQRQWPGDRLGKSQTPETAETVRLGEAAAFPEAVELDGTALAAVTDGYLVKNLDGKRFDNAAFTAFATYLIFYAESVVSQRYSSKFS